MQNTILIGIGALLVGIIVGIFFLQSPMYSWPGSGMMHTANDGWQESPAVADRGPTAMGQHGMGMMGGGMFITSERDFIENMIPHHEEAIATAQEVLERGGTTQGMIDLAENIITSQTAEVALMKESHQEWFGEAYQATGEYEPMMRDLAPYSGVALDRVFLHDMTMHHMGAIMMARSVRPYVEHEVMRELTDNIIVNQSREIETMQQLFTALPDGDDN